jgi:hypothetical protein
LWLIKVWFSASTFVVKIATFAKPENVMCHTAQHFHYRRCESKNVLYHFGLSILQL